MGRLFRGFVMWAFKYWRAYAGAGLYLNLAGFLVGSFSGQRLYALGGSIIRTRLDDHPDLDVINFISGGLLIGFAVWQCARI